MYDFETLVGELLRNRPELDRSELMRRVEEKKRTVGAGYLTDQGALFLVAGELGVSLQSADPSADMSINDLYIGANDVTVVARVLAVYPTSAYKKKDGGAGKYKRLVLFDGHQAARLTAWDEKAEEIEKSEVGPGVAVRVANGYVKQGLDGKPNLNLGRRGRIEVLADEKAYAKLVPLSAVAEKLSRINQEKQFMAVECVVASEPRYSEFVRSDGSPGSLFQFGVLGEGKMQFRMVIWSPTAKPELKPGQKVMVTNVRSKRTTGGEFELHGDAGSTIVLQTKVASEELRVASVNVGPLATIVLALDRGGKVRLVEVGPSGGEIERDQVVGVKPDSESDGRLYCRTPGSFEVVGDESFPALESLTTKLRDAKDEASQIMVEVIALSHGTVDDVNLRDGTTVKKGELTVGDDTSEIKLVAWREQSGKLSGIQPGERLRIVGASPKATRLGAWVLQVSNLTAIERLRGRS